MNSPPRKREGRLCGAAIRTLKLGGVYRTFKFPQLKRFSGAEVWSVGLTLGAVP